MKTLKQKLHRWLKDNPGFHASGSLQRMEWRDSKGKLASPSNITRRLRELAEAGVIKVDYRSNHAWYSAEPRKVVPLYEVNGQVLIDGKWVEKGLVAKQLGA